MLIKVYLPHADEQNKNLKKVQQLEIANDVLQCWLIDTYGGYTLYKAEGGWKNSKGLTICDTVNVYEVYADNTQETKLVLELLHIKNISKEESIAYVIDNEIKFLQSEAPISTVRHEIKG